MRKFDVESQAYKLDQYWSALVSAGNNVKGQVNSGVSDILFSTNHVVQNRNIVSDSASSIRLDSTAASVSAPAFTNFALGMVIYPELADVWIIRIDTGIEPDDFSDVFTDKFVNPVESQFAGVKVNADSTISLLWPYRNSVREQKILFTEQVSYLALTLANGMATLQLNDSQVSQEADELSLTGFTMGAGTNGAVLVDKIAFSTQGTIPPSRQYFNLFRSQRLDNVSRPNGKAAFSYTNDIKVPVIQQIDQSQFLFEDGYFYATYQNIVSDGVWSIDKRAPFAIEYSIDQGSTWLTMPVQLNLNLPYANIAFRHAVDSDQTYYIEIRTTGTPEIPLAFFDTTISGALHLPARVGQGYYDVEYSNSANAKIRITPQADTTAIRSVELLGSSDTIRDLIDDSSSSQYPVINGDFENGYDNWFNSNASAVTSSTAEFHSGSKSIRVVNGGELRKDDPAEQYDTVQGDRWQLSAWQKNESFTGAGGIRLQRRQDGAWIDLGSTETPAIGAGWTYMFARGTVPAGVDKVRARMAFAGSGVTYYDDVKLTRLTSAAVSRTNGRNFETYINGQKRDWNTMRPGQIYHVIIVFDEPVSWVDIQAYELSGIGASELAYTESDAYFIYNVFAGNTFVSSLETIGAPVDGLAPNADGANAAAALQVQWNS